MLCVVYCTAQHRRLYATSYCLGEPNDSVSTHATSHVIDQYAIFCSLNWDTRDPSPHPHSRWAARSQHALWRPANATASIMAPRSPSMQEETIWTGRRVAQHEMMTATHHVAIVPHQCPCASRNRRPRSAASAAACCRLRRLSVRPPHRALSVELSGDGTAVLVVGDARDTAALN